MAVTPASQTVRSDNDGNGEREKRTCLQLCASEGLSVQGVDPLLNVSLRKAGLAKVRLRGEGAGIPLGDRTVVLVLEDRLSMSADNVGVASSNVAALADREQAVVRVDGLCEQCHVSWLRECLQVCFRQVSYVSCVSRVSWVSHVSHVGQVSWVS